MYWDSFGKYKRCKECNKLLPLEFSICNVHHLLPKSLYDDVKYDSRYFMLLCIDCHHAWETYRKGSKIRKYEEIAKELYDSENNFDNS